MTRLDPFRGWLDISHLREPAEEIHTSAMKGGHVPAHKRREQIARFASLQPFGGFDERGIFAAVVLPGCDFRDETLDQSWIFQFGEQIKHLRPLGPIGLILKSRVGWRCLPPFHHKLCQGSGFP